MDFSPVSGYGHWTAWCDCSESCDGSQYRTRSRDNQNPACDGHDCVNGHTDTETQPCNEGACCTDGMYSHVLFQPSL